MGPGRKRGISDLLNDSQDPSHTSKTSNRHPRTFVRLDDTASQETKRPTGLENPSSQSSLSKFLAYPKISTFKPKPIPFQQPSQLISFSYTPEHVQEFTDSALRYFVDPPLGSNLSFGYDRWVMKFDDRGRIDALLKAISKVKAEAIGGSLPEIGVVSWRGIMTKSVPDSVFAAKMIYMITLLLGETGF
jgi:RAT1-interacting protein